MLTFACEEQLELQPEQSLSTEEALGDINGQRAALIGAYDALQQVNYYGREYIVMPEVEANLVYLSINNSNRFVDNYIYQWNAQNGDITGFWNDSYEVTLSLNNILNTIDNVEADQGEKDQIKGEALALRALVLFDQVRVFGKQYTQSNPTSDLGVPIVLEGGINEPPRSTIEENYNRIIADLNTAKPLLSNIDVGRFSPEAVDALLARVYLYQDDNANAVSAATSVINAGYELDPNLGVTDVTPNGIETRRLVGPGLSTEEIFTLRFRSDENRGADNLGQIYNPQGYGDVRVTTDLIDLYEEGDTRLEYIYLNDDGEYYNSKFLTQDNTPGLHSPKLLRIAEMYLIRAEANAKQQNYSEAIDDLNAIRTVRNATELTDVPDEQVLQAVLDERKRELAFEGHTKFDYWRNGIDMIRKQCNTGLELNAPCEVEASSFLTVYPIPQREMDVNQQMVQNPGYLQ